MRSRALSFVVLLSLLTRLAVARSGQTQEPVPDSTGGGSGSRAARAGHLTGMDGGGGGGPVAFSFTMNAAFLSEASGPLGVRVVLRTTHPVLPESVTVAVADAGTGSASAGSDYVAFATQTLAFPAGSLDGATRTVALVPIDDPLDEAGSESIRLRLQDPVGGALAGFTRFTAILADDDAFPGPLFEASEGPSGTENPLVHDELLSLGTDAVGGPPSAGTLVRVTNVGGEPMELGPPQLSGPHANDFAVEVEGLSMLAAEIPYPIAEATDLLSASEQDAGPGLVFRIDASELARLRAYGAIALRDLALPGLGPVTLALRRRELPIRDDARLVVDGRDVAGGPRTLVGDLTVWTGIVEGVEGSRVFLALGGSFAQGFVELPFALGRVHVLADGRGTVRLVHEAELPALGARQPTGFCAGARSVPGRRTSASPSIGPAPTAAVTVADCRLALETDWEFFQLFGTSALATQYVTGLVAAISEQYVTDVQTALSIAYLGLHTTANDGWTTQDEGGDCLQLLEEFQAAWGTSWPAQADLAHFLSGAALVGGVANLDVLCDHAEGFGVSSELMGNIDWPSWTGAPGNFTWDFLIVAHEIGHNFGALHTHDHCPPLDRCWSSCSGPPVCSRGTLMSYCYGCAGGTSNVDLVFHPVQADIMRQRVLASCLEDTRLGADDHVLYRVRFNPLTTTGPRNAVLDFPHDASNVAQPFRVRLSGIAN